MSQVQMRIFTQVAAVEHFFRSNCRVSTQSFETPAEKPDLRVFRAFREAAAIATASVKVVSPRIQTSLDARLLTRDKVRFFKLC